MGVSATLVGRTVMSVIHESRRESWPNVVLVAVHESGKGSI
jgi:hypothetical protein